MKKLLLILTIILAVSAFSQNQQTETTVKKVEASYPGGISVFRDDFMKMVYAYVDITAYAVNGKFTFIINIDENGKMTGLKSFPRVKNDDEFVEDMNFALKRLKKKWKPASLNDVPVATNISLQINFSSDHSDHE